MVKTTDIAPDLKGVSWPCSSQCSSASRTTDAKLLPLLSATESRRSATEVFKTSDRFTKSLAAMIKKFQKTLMRGALPT